MHRQWHTRLHSAKHAHCQDCQIAKAIVNLSRAQWQHNITLPWSCCGSCSKLTSYCNPFLELVSYNMCHTAQPAPLCAQPCHECCVSNVNPVLLSRHKCIYIQIRQLASVHMHKTKTQEMVVTWNWQYYSNTVADGSSFWNYILWLRHLRVKMNINPLCVDSHVQPALTMHSVLTARSFPRAPCCSATICGSW